MAQFAVIKTGGKQYVVSPNDTVKIEKLGGEAGGSVVFSDVLLVGDDSMCTVGAPTVEKASVEGTVLRQARDKKKIVFKYHSKARERKLKGHRQNFTEVKITNIKSA